MDRALFATLTLALLGCGGDGAAPVSQNTASVRAERRAYDGAPPVIPHEDFGIDCLSCHAEGGVEVPDVGLSPQMPHGETAGISEISRCTQCHVFVEVDDLFVRNALDPLRQDLRHGSRMYPQAPPTIPHRVFMRENCAACHTGPAAREEIRTSHPERVRCRQCHVPAATGTRFASDGVES